MERCKKDLTMTTPLLTKLLLTHLTRMADVKDMVVSGNKFF